MQIVIKIIYIYFVSNAVIIECYMSHFICKYIRKVDSVKIYIVLCCSIMKEILQNIADLSLQIIYK